MLCSGSCSASSHSFQFLSCAKAVPMADKLTITNAAAIAEAISVFTLLSYLVWCALSFRDNLKYRVASHPWWSRHACGWPHFLVAYTSTRDLFLLAKHLFVAAIRGFAGFMVGKRSHEHERPNATSDEARDFASCLLSPRPMAPCDNHSGPLRWIDADGAHPEEIP